MTNKLRVGIVFGGKSTEHEVSIRSAQAIAQGLDRSRYVPILIEVDKCGRWRINDQHDALHKQAGKYSANASIGSEEIALLRGISGEQLVSKFGAKFPKNIDVFFPIVHGTSGEDGCLQGLLRVAGLPFVGSDVLASAICMDKDVAKRLLRDAGVPVTPFITMNRTNAKRTSFERVKEKLGMPVFVKPANQGSSVGVRRASDQDSFYAAVDLALRFDHKILIEAAVVGREVECAVLGNDNPIVSSCGEIVIDKEFYTYGAKYHDPQTRILVPANISAAVEARIQNISLRVFETLGCSGLARIDCFLTENDEVIVNEVNSLPGFTPSSMYPALWDREGLGFESLLSHLIELALERHIERNMLTTVNPI
ncbi:MULTISPECIES: D-alanine--D-alanine ligase [unclassified Pseudomonas]|uniref:D-alanine--D-alanine ligase n=1 Tax=unclassified Pseudomonas TaxID=196821 RepID=UPI000A1D8C6F|nr:MULTISPECIES: D-alanine--D-alanine ligase [unclassified Pseudomonas]